MKNWTQKRVFAMCGALLLTLTTEVVAISYYWSNLQGGPWRWPLLLGLIVVGYGVMWATYWYSKEDEPLALVKTAFFVALGISVMMVFNSAMILTVRTNQKKAQDSQVAAAQIEANKTDQENRAKIAQIQAESDATMAASKDWRVLREIRLEREAKAKLDAETKRREELQNAAAPKAVVVAAPAASEDFKDIIEFAQWYCKALVFFLPLIIAVIGEFTLGYVIAFKRKAWMEMPAAGRQPMPSSSPIGAPNPSPLPGPMPVRTPNSVDIPLRERIAMGNGGPGGPKN